MIRYERYARDVPEPNLVAEYKYDVYGRRLQKSVNGAVTNFFWEGDNLAYELTEDYKPIRRYMYGPGMDDVEGHFEYSENTGYPLDPSKKGWYTYVKDQVGTVYQVFDETTRVESSMNYDTFGNLVNQAGSSKGHLAFQGKYYDSETGLYYFYHRYYNPTLGRFMTEDPIGLKGGLNMFRFVGNNPVQKIDPFGLVDGNNFRNDYNPWDPQYHNQMAHNPYEIIILLGMLDNNFMCCLADCLEKNRFDAMFPGTEYAPILSMFSKRLLPPFIIVNSGQRYTTVLSSIAHFFNGTMNGVKTVLRKTGRFLSYPGTFFMAVEGTWDWAAIAGCIKHCF